MPLYMRLFAFIFLNRYGKSKASAMQHASEDSYYVCLTTASSTFSPSPHLDVCPSGVAEFTCTVEDDGTPEATLWRINEATIDCIVFHSDASLNRSCGPFHLTLNSAVENSYTSVLSISSVSLALNNTQVQCRGPSISNVVGTSSLRIIGVGLFVLQMCVLWAML